MTEQFRPQPETPKQHAPEAGAGPLGIPPPELEQQPLPSVWDVLERHVRLFASDVEDRPRWGSQDYNREFDEVDRLEKEIDEKGTDYDRLIMSLHSAITIQPGAGGPLLRRLSLEEFQQLRARVERLSEEELAEEILKAKEEHERKLERIHKRNSESPPSLGRP